MHGKGQYSWLDGRNYSGNYNMDKKEGYGVYTWVILYYFRLIKDNIQGSGKMENSMLLEPILIKKELEERDNGRRAKD